jgi:hypothetical protein
LILMLGTASGGVAAPAAAATPAMPHKRTKTAIGARETTIVAGDILAGDFFAFMGKLLE